MAIEFTLADLRVLALILSTLFQLTGGPAEAQRPNEPRTLAERLVREFVLSHQRDLAAMEIALLSGTHCATVAATDPKDVGEACDDDEKGPIRTGVAHVDDPTADDPVFDITQALHDRSGRLIGAVGMDIKPHGDADRASALTRARALLRELEARIPSAAALR